MPVETTLSRRKTLRQLPLRSVVRPLKPPVALGPSDPSDSMVIPMAGTSGHDFAMFQLWLK